jgi:hypothetical protein
MAASDRSSDSSPPANDASESGVGMAHLTIVPTNFDPDDSSERGD